MFLVEHRFRASFFRLDGDGRQFSLALSLRITCLTLMSSPWQGVRGLGGVIKELGHTSIDVLKVTRVHDLVRQNVLTRFSLVVSMIAYGSIGGSTRLVPA